MVKEAKEHNGIKNATLLRLLQAIVLFNRGKQTMQYISERLDVSERTVYRYVQVLQEVGFQFSIDRQGPGRPSRYELLSWPPEIFMTKTMLDTNETLHAGARFSDCGNYRYSLWRIWNHSKPLVMVIGLNPSTANGVKNDQTIARLITMVRSWGYGGFYMMNLFAWVTPYPKELFQQADPVGENDFWLQEIAGKCKDVVFAWGNFKVFGRDKKVIAMFPNALCFGKNANGTPMHPRSGVYNGTKATDHKLEKFA